MKIHTQTILYKAQSEVAAAKYQSIYQEVLLTYYLTQMVC